MYLGIHCLSNILVKYKQHAFFRKPGLYGDMLHETCFHATCFMQFKRREHAKVLCHDTFFWEVGAGWGGGGLHGGNYGLTFVSCNICRRIHPSLDI